MATLFYLNSKNTAVLHDECYKLCPDLRMVTKDEILYIILAYDYKSPFHQFPEEDRVLKARRQVWGNDASGDPERKKTVQKAIQAYMSIQYDHRRETIKKYRNKQRLIENQLIHEESATKIKGYIDTINILEKNCTDLQQKIDFDEQQAELKGGGKKSLIEQMQESKELFELWNPDVIDDIDINIEYPDDHEK